MAVYLCGHCAGAPMLGEGALASHARCPGGMCVCDQDSHQPTERVLIGQAKFCLADGRLVLDIAPTWTWGGLEDVAAERARKVRDRNLGTKTQKSARRAPAAASTSSQPRSPIPAEPAEPERSVSAIEEIAAAAAAAEKPKRRVGAL